MTRALVVIINYHTSELIPQLLETIEEQGLSISICILDNASNEATFAPLQQLQDKRVHLLRSAENLGFTGGINFVLRSKFVQEGGFKYFFLLNPDAFCKKNLIGDLAMILENNSDAACVSPRILYMDGKPWYQGGKIHYRKGKVIMEQGSPASNLQFSETEVFNGCAALFDLQKVQEAGLFNEGLFMYYDEAELSIKLHKLGYRILYAPNLAIKHDVSYTTRNISHLKTYYMTRNKFMVFNNTMSKAQKFYFLAHELAFHFKHRRLKNMLYHIRGYLDFTRGKVGALK